MPRHKNIHEATLPDGLLEGPTVFDADPWEALLRFAATMSEPLDRRPPRYRDHHPAPAFAREWRVGILEAMGRLELRVRQRRASRVTLLVSDPFPDEPARQVYYKLLATPAPRRLRRSIRV